VDDCDYAGAELFNLSRVPSGNAKLAVFTWKNNLSDLLLVVNYLVWEVEV